jgi:predicted lipoprotein with Yx(FWY)xxD motif
LHEAGRIERSLSVLAVVAVLAGGVAELPDARGHSAVLKLRKTRVGTILVDGRGFTLYAFTKDRPGVDACAQVRDCLRVWPALTTSGPPVAGPGVKRSLIGTIKLRSGATQVTYGGHPLYGYVADRAPGQTYYVNITEFGARWPAVDANGHEVK